MLSSPSPRIMVVSTAVLGQRRRLGTTAAAVAGAADSATDVDAAAAAGAPAHDAAAAARTPAQDAAAA